MIRHGVAPFLECSSKGDRRFSAFYARIRALGNKSIEELYQCSKIINGEHVKTWREGKGKTADNADYCARYYTYLWQMYMWENPDLINVLLAAQGLSDIFGKSGRQCQANELWNIRNNATKG